MTAPSTEAECRAFAAAIQAHQQGSAWYSADRLATLGITRPGGGANNTVYRCGWNARACCIKVYRTDGRRRDEREWLALHLLANHCPGLAPRPLWRDPDPSLPLVAMEIVPGQSLRDHPVSPHQLTALADTLRHLQTITPADAAFPYRSAGAAEQLLARVEHWLSTDNPESTAGSSGPTAHPSPRRRTSWPAGHSAATSVARLLPPSNHSADCSSALPTLPIVRALARQRLTAGDSALILTPEPSTFSRGDPNLANCLWDAASGQVRLIDFEYAGWGDLAGDLADLIEGPWARHVPDDDWLTFASSLGLPTPSRNPRFLAARHVCATFWVMKFAEQFVRDPSAAQRDILSRQLARTRRLLEETA